ncbi:MAG: hypothetical protein KGL63_01730 [Betaproteobacteria bacterium]|nr:hypothetical protein [Betaproteobacteria bacterium]
MAGILATARRDDFEQEIFAAKAILRFPNGVLSGSWESKPSDQTMRYVRADRIEALEAALAEARGQVAALRGALETWIDPCGDPGCEECNVLFDTAATAQAHDAEVERKGWLGGMEEAAELVVSTAEIVDYPSVYMDGPSNRAKKIAEAFAAAIRAAAGEAKG